MTALIVDHAGGRCDSRCHEATLPGCGCICGGSLHGAGSSSAAQARLQQLVAGGMLGERPATVVRNLFDVIEVVEVTDMDAAAARCSVPDEAIPARPAGRTQGQDTELPAIPGEPANAQPRMCAVCGTYRAATAWVRNNHLCAKCRGVA